jgi:hypothetical protein
VPALAVPYREDGNMSKYTIPISVDDIVRAIESGEYMGFCIACGLEHMGIEPDARRYPCESCGEKAVYGAQELLFYVQA